jgi:hypothetical protein
MWILMSEYAVSFGADCTDRNSVIANRTWAMQGAGTRRMVLTDAVTRTIPLSNESRRRGSTPIRRSPSAAVGQRDCVTFYIEVT